MTRRCSPTSSRTPSDLCRTWTSSATATRSSRARQLGRAQRVVIAGHIDTVPINDNVPTRDVEIDGEPFVWGRGTVDMKAGVAVQLKLAAELSDPRIDITWMWYDHEEVDADLNGLTRLARTRPDLFAGDFAILGEPSNGAVEGGCNGNMRVIVRTHGVRSHSARAWVGENAIHKAAPVLVPPGRIPSARGSRRRPGVPRRAERRARRRRCRRQRDPRPVRGRSQLPVRSESVRGGRRTPRAGCLRRVRRRSRRRRGGGTAGAGRAARPGVRHRGRRPGAAEVRLDGRGPVLGDGRSGGQLRTRRPAPGPPRRGAGSRTRRSRKWNADCGRG